MQVTVQIIENNKRDSGGIAHINGVQVTIDSIAIQGSEKQVAWADQIARKAIRLLVEERVNKAAPNGLMAGADLDALVAKINAELVGLAARLDGKPASAWIDGRAQLPALLLRAVVAA